MMKKSLLMFLLWMPGVIMAQNPIISGQFTADPTARVFNNRVYMYPSHDIKAPEGQRQDWFCMADYHVFSSENLVDWHDHGMIITQNSVPWVRPDSYSMWAPDCVEKNGKYYFYFPSAPNQNARGFAVGVAVADRPEGPFKCEEQPINGVFGIDPCVLIDDDGQAYIYWSGMGIRGAKLKSNMFELDGELQEIRGPQGGPGMKVGGVAMEGLPDGFKEGPFAFKQGGHYYLTFPWVRKENGTETLAYAMSDKPLGPWEFKGVFMEESPTGCWTNHHSFVQYKGQWYLFYHHNDYSPSFDKNRSARIDKVSFNADGTINMVKPTLRGVGVVDALGKIEIDRYSKAGDGVEVALLDTCNTFLGWDANLKSRNSWVQFDDVDFSNLKKDAYLITKVKADANTALVVRENNASGKVIARIDVTVISDGQFRRDNSGQWMNLTAKLQYIPKGVTNLYVAPDGEGLHVDWIQFKNRPDYFSTPTGAQSKPDADGFIRRWMLLEPIDKPNRSNTVFVDSYLDEQIVNTQYFKNQLTMLPKPGQKMKVGKQNLLWHAVESNTFNVRLFRFAELAGKQTYGVLFWAVTVIDCPEQIDDVRLAAGSNGSSIWWLDGKEVLRLSGDRRMVKDDGMSPRITLKKGRNILRTAVINGPGLSDFCVRFVDGDGKPVTNYQIIY